MNNIQSQIINGMYSQLYGNYTYYGSHVQSVSLFGILSHYAGGRGR